MASEGSTFTRALQHDLSPHVINTHVHPNNFFTDERGSIHLPTPRRTIPQEMQEYHPPRTDFLFGTYDAFKTSSSQQKTVEFPPAPMDSCETFKRPDHSTNWCAPIHHELHRGHQWASNNVDIVVDEDIEMCAIMDIDSDPVQSDPVQSDERMDCE